MKGKLKVKAIKKILLAVIISIAIFVIVLIYLFVSPALIRGRYFEQPSFIEYGNTSANLHNGGRVCEYGDDVLIRTSEGIMIFSMDDYQMSNLIEETGNNINVVDGIIYFDAAWKGIQQYDIEKNKLSIMPGSLFHSSNSLQVVGDKAFTYINVTFSSISQINIDKGTRHYIRGRGVPRNCEYYEGNIYYINEGYEDYENDWVCKLTDEGENIGLFDVYRSVKYFIYEGSIYYSLYNAEKFPDKLGIWRYDLETNKNEKIMKSDKDIFLYNIIDGKLLYRYPWIDNSYEWCSFDIETNTVVKHEEENRSVAGYIYCS